MNKANIEAVYKLSPMQEGLLFHSLEQEGGTTYFQQVHCVLEGPIERSAFAAAWRRVIARHAMLRTGFHWKETKKPVQVVHRQVELEPVWEDWRGEDGEAREQRLARFLRQDRERGFELEKPPLVRLFLARIDTQRHRFVWSYHHLLLDGWSLPLVLREVFDHYRAEVRGVALELPPARPYRDYISWLDRQDLAQAETFWRQTLDGFSPTRLEVRTPETLVGDTHGRCEHRLDDATSARLEARARAWRITSNTVLQGVWALLLGRYTDRREVVLGATASGRPSDLPGVQSIVGLFINTLPVAVRSAAGATARQWLEELQRGQARGRRFGYAPLSQIQKWGGFSRQEPLFDSLFVFENYPLDGATPSREDTLRIREVGAIELTNYPFNLLVSRGERLGLSFLYQRRRMDEVTAARLLEHFQNLLAGLLTLEADDDLDQLELMGSAERHQLLVTWNGEGSGPSSESRTVEPGGSTLHGLFALQAERTPSAIALDDHGVTWTYGELLARSWALATRLEGLGVGSGSRVAVFLDRRAELVVGMLGILGAGGAYIPLDPAYPKERLRFILRDTAASVIVTRSANLERLPDHRARCLDLDDLEAAPATDLGEVPPGMAGDGTHAVGPGHLAYVIYTSGSTGLPKGVAIEHRSAVAMVRWARRAFVEDELAAVLASTSICFDLSVFEIFAPLAWGGRVILAENALELSALPSAHEVTMINTVPSAMAELLNQNAVPDSVRTINLAGEPLHATLVERIAATTKAQRVRNLYGPSEDTTYSTEADVDTGEAIPSIGRPIDGTRAFVVDSCFRPVPVGVAGELLLAGDGLARGYLNRPAATAERFLPDPWSPHAGGRLYRTGDRVHLAADGRLRFLGRRDHQVKVRGFRIELGEIETTLANHEAVAEATVLVHDAGSGPRLVAYFVLQADTEASVATLRKFLADSLPEYMVPAFWVRLSALPLTVNGKVDRKALPAPGRSFESDYAPPQTPGEVLLAEIWSAVLGVESPGIHDNFLELGGDSILAIQVAGRANRQGLGLTPRHVFEHPTLAELARLGQSLGHEIEAEQGRLEGAVALGPIQHWFRGLELEHWHHWNQSVFLASRQPLDTDRLHTAVARLIEHHDALRLRFRPTGEEWQAHYASTGDPVPYQHHDLSELPADQAVESLERAAATLQGQLDPVDGPLLRVASWSLGESLGDRLLIVVHHLVVDGVSWRILLEDLEAIYKATTEPGGGETFELPPKTTSVRQWHERLAESARSGALAEQREIWLGAAATVEGAHFPRSAASPATAPTLGSARSFEMVFDGEETEALLKTIPRTFRTGIETLLLTALARATGEQLAGPLWVDLESHGRADLFAEVDLSRTVGWLTSLYPVCLDVTDTDSPVEALQRVKERLRAVPDRGVGYGALRYLGDATTRSHLARQPASEVLFNYLGQLDLPLAASETFTVASESSGRARSPEGRPTHRLSLDARIAAGRLRITWVHTVDGIEEVIDELATAFRGAIRGLIEQCGRPGAFGRTPSDFPLVDLEQRWLDQLVLEGREVDDIYPLSPVQEGMLFHSLSDPESAIYFEQLSWRIGGDLDREVFRRTWQWILDRYPILRTAFVWEGLDQPVQRVDKGVEMPYREIDWRDLDQATRRQALRTFLAEDRRRGFDFSQAPLVRLALLRLDASSSQVVLSYHHALMDGWSLPILLGEVFAVYEALRAGREPTLAKASTFREYIAWLGRQDLDQAETFWRGVLEGFREPTPMPAERVVGEALDALQIYDEQSLRLSAELSSSLRDWARRHRLTLNSLVQGAWAVLLAQTSGVDDIVYGTTVAGRPPEIPSIESMIGLFINTLPVRIRIEPDRDLVAWLRAIQSQQIEQRQYEFTPLPRIQEWSEVANGTALFDSILVFENYPLNEALPGVAQVLQVDEVVSFHRASFPLTLVAIPGSRTLFRLSFDRRRFDPTTVERFLAHWHQLLRSITEQDEPRVGQLSLLTPTEREQLLGWSSTASHHRSAQTMTELFEQQVDRLGDEPALVCEGRSLTYGEVDRRANRLAHRLRAAGVGPEVPVGLCSERSLEFCIAVLAILKAGGYFIPLDPTYPRDRLNAMLEISRCRVVLLERRDLGEDLISGLVSSLVSSRREPLVLDEMSWDTEEPESRLRPTATPDNAVYTIFTSGSTGRPKGVLVAHRHLWSHLQGILERLELPPRAKIPTVSTISADVGMTPLFGSLCFGGTLYVVPDDLARSPDGLSQSMAEQRLDFLKIVPSHLMALVHNASEPFNLPGSRMLVGGETFFWRDAETLQEMAPEIGIFNHYGPTETTVGVMTYRHRREDQQTLGSRVPWLPLGRPLRGARIFVVDRQGRLAPIGAPGEIVIGGASVSRGYLHQPGKTAERFRPDALSGGSGQRLYHSGDKGAVLPDGQIEFHGRVDFQVKVRGFRVELEEIQGTLNQHPEVQSAVVVAHRIPSGDARLVAYVVPQKDRETLDFERLREDLATRLPSPMIPGDFVALDTMPLNPNGKIDRSQLPDPTLSAHPTTEAVVEPRNTTEAVLAEIWSEVLDKPSVSVEADYFDLGGDSLTAIRILARIKKSFGIPLSAREFFTAATVTNLAEIVDATRRGETTAARQGLDLAARVVLDPTIRGTPAEGSGIDTASIADPSAVFLTGATGFVGTFLLAELLRQTRARIHCLVRAGNADSGLERLRQSFETLGLDWRNVEDRVVAVPGDLSRPGLGLRPSTFGRLAEECDAIYHNGALVNFVYPYESLERPNVFGTEEALRLAVTGRPKPLHFVSTVSVFESSGFAGRPFVDESDDPAESRGLSDGYVQSKWVAEKLVELARDRGVPVAIYRLGRVAWHSQTGAWAQTDFINRMLRSCLQLGGAPELDTAISLAPVDYVTRGLVALSLQARSSSYRFHLTNPDPVPWSRLVEWLRGRGFPLESWSFHRWQGELLDDVRGSEENALYPMAAFQAEGTGQTSRAQTDRQLAYLERRSAVVRCDRTLAELARLGIDFPTLDERAIGPYLRFLENEGFHKSTPRIAESV